MTGIRDLKPYQEFSFSFYFSSLLLLWLDLSLSLSFFPGPPGTAAKNVLKDNNLKNNTNESIYKTETDSDTGNKFMVTKGEG